MEVLAVIAAFILGFALGEWLGNRKLLRYMDTVHSHGPTPVRPSDPPMPDAPPRPATDNTLLDGHRKHDPSFWPDAYNAVERAAEVKATRERELED